MIRTSTDDFGRNGRACRETDVEATDLEAVITDLLAGQYQSPVRVVGFNMAEGWCQDVSANVARELRHRCGEQMRDVPFFLQDFVDQHEGRMAMSSYRCRCALRGRWLVSATPASAANGAASISAGSGAKTCSLCREGRSRF